MAGCARGRWRLNPCIDERSRRWELKCAKMTTSQFSHLLGMLYCIQCLAIVSASGMFLGMSWGEDTGGNHAKFGVLRRQGSERRWGSTGLVLLGTSTTSPRTECRGVKGTTRSIPGGTTVLSVVVGLSSRGFFHASSSVPHASVQHIDRCCAVRPP